MRVPSLSLARLELRRFARGRLPRAALVALLLLPLLYGALYLWSFWDPRGHLDKLPVALVNEDRPVTVQGQRIAAGQQLTDELIQRQVFGWQTVSAQDAAKGVADGRYYLSLVIPAGFSRDIGSSDSDDPSTAALRVETNDSNNYIVGQVSRTVFDEVRAAASAKTSQAFYDRIFIAFSDIHDQTAKAAAGADRLTSGADQAERGAGTLASGTASAASGAQQLANGLDQAKQGSDTLSQGLSALDQGASRLTAGARQAAAGTQQLVDAVDPVAADLSPLLHRYGTLINLSATAVADGAQQIAANLGKLPGASAQALADARGAAAKLDAAYAAQCGPGTVSTVCSALRTADQAAHQVVAVATQVNAAVQQLAPQIDGLRQDAARVAALAKPLEQPGLAGRFDTAVSRLHQLNSGVQQLASGSAALESGTAQALGGAQALDSGLGTLDSGAHTLSGGLYRLSTGLNQLQSGLGQLADGSGQLATGLHNGAAQIPAYDSGQRAARSSAMSDPIKLANAELNPAATYGTGLAPYFIPLALWVGAMVGYMLLRPLSNRALSANAPAWRVMLAGWLPVAGIGLLQAAALLAVLHWVIGLQFVRAAGTVGFLALTVLTFSAVMQWLNARFGPAGRLLALALLMLQLTSAGGTYPVETSPSFFGAIHPFLPMSYVVEGLRRLISGGDLGVVWTACAVLPCFLAGALLLTTLTARRRQMWTLSRLHPELSL
jgi:putative membrane protein